MSRTIILFGITSLFADIAGEMIFPVLPMFFTVELGLSAALLGVIEGVSEGVGNLIQVWFGWISDRLRKRKFFVILGYLTAASGKFFLGIAGSWPLVAISRLMDRGGKGIRTSPRDALLAESIEEERRGLAFGFHRMMDSSGAIIGNILVIWLIGQQIGMRSIVWLSVIPALLAVIFLLPVREVQGGSDPTVSVRKKIALPSWRDFTQDRLKFGREFWRFIFVSIFFHLGKISYAYLLLRIGQFGVPLRYVPYFYLLFNIVQTVFSLLVGKLADAFGKAILVFFSFILFSTMSFGFIFGGDMQFLLGLFVVYGLALAFLEVGLRAFLVELSPAEFRATGLGIFFTVSGIMVMLGGVIAGVLWTIGDGVYAFAYGTGMTAIAALLFFVCFWRRIFGALQRLVRV
jgi:MFS family permease